MQLILKLLAAATIGGLLYLMLGPAPAAEGSVQNLDKIAHLIAFATIAGCLSVLFPKVDLPIICLSALLLGGGVEITQGEIGRDASWADFIFDGIGIAAYWVAVHLWCRRIDAS
jgi:hypothetical protein